MKKNYIYLLLGALLLLTSVSCSASPPSYDVGYVEHEPSIKQMATAQMPMELTITPDAYAMELKMVELIPVQLCNDVKPTPVVQSVCSSTLPNIGFHYIEGIATEYSV